jgi:MATE family multidrug resistance protein
MLVSHKRGSFQDSCVDLLGRGAPILLVQLTVVGNSVIDTITSGNLSPVDIAAVGLGSSIYTLVFVILAGFMFAISPVAAQLRGAGRYVEMVQAVWQCVWMSLPLSVAGAFLLSESVRWIDQVVTDPDVVRQLRFYIIGCTLALPGTLVFRAYYSYSIAMGIRGTPALIAILMLALKVPLNLILAFGVPGIVPAFGGAGCAIATAITAAMSSLFALTVLWRHSKEFARAADDWCALRLRAIGELVRVGLPIAAVQFVEVGAFVSMALLIAPLGTLASAAHQIAANVATTFFMVPFSLSMAMSIELAEAIGSGKRSMQQSIVRESFAVVLALSGFVAFALIALRQVIGRLYTSDPLLAEFASALLLWVGLSQVPDAIQVFFIAAYRARKIGLPPLLATVLGRGITGLGVGAFLAFGELGLGAKGFWIGAAAGLCVTGAILYLSYNRTFPASRFEEHTLGHPNPK